jgi:hypothetical protein
MTETPNEKRTTHVLLAVHHSADERVSGSDVGDQVLDALETHLRELTKTGAVDDDLSIELLDARDEHRPLAAHEIAVNVSNVDRVEHYIQPVIGKAITLPVLAAGVQPPGLALYLTSSGFDRHPPSDERLVEIAREIAARVTAPDTVVAFVRKLAALTLCDDVPDAERDKTCTLDSGHYCGTHHKWIDDVVIEARKIIGGAQ